MPVAGSNKLRYRARLGASGRPEIVGNVYLAMVPCLSPWQAAQRLRDEPGTTVVVDGVGGITKLQQIWDLTGDQAVLDQ